jgi:hypothetical protein
LAAVAIITAVTGLACSDILGSASRSPIASISALSLPYPTVVIGDVMRDSLGVTAPVSIQAFDASGKLVTDQSPQFTILDATTNTLASTVQIDQSGIVHGIARDTVGARVFASFGTLTAPAQRVFVSVAPTKAAQTPGPWEISFVDTIPDTLTATNWSPPLALTLSDANGIGAQGFVVTYAVTRYPAPQTAGDTAAYIGDDAGKPSGRDTTDLKGVASRRVVLRQRVLADSVRAGTHVDTIIVRATVRYNGVDVPGTPLDYIVPVMKKP